MMRRRSIALAVTLALGAAVSGCAGEDGGASKAADTCSSGPVTVGYLPKLGTDPYMTTLRDGAKAAAEEIGGEVVYTAPSEATGAAQIPFVNQLIAQKVGAIVISGSDLNGAAAALRKARRAGIKVISVDSDVATDARSLFVNQAKTSELGAKMLDSMAELIGHKGEFAVLSSTETAVNQNAWIEDMKSRLATDPKLKDMKLVTVAYGQEKADVNAQKAKSLVQAYPKLKGIIVPAGIGLPAAAEALSQTGDLGRVKLTGLAPASLIKKYIRGGDVQDIWWNVHDLGGLSYHAAQALAQCKVKAEPGERIPAGELGTYTVGERGEVVLGPATVVTPKNIDDFEF
ncbi:monosaccharide ABC transporter substrate-binding protein, CUT2 family [Streptomyces sp. DI166]|nr:substrate-binding domain-containing protein [Streptomyces sp. DI166]SBT89973.1 monosaccharide ABC transporter substrate-binding protein, CUT2 family [Streptomyces sp. DI166]